jgi:hypothetical protein
MSGGALIGDPLHDFWKCRMFFDANDFQPV